MTTPGSDVDPIVRHVTVSSEPLSTTLHESAVAHPGAGGRVVFCGIVRNTDAGRDVVELEYEGHPSAEAVLLAVAERFAAEQGVLALAVSHRVGRLAIGDVALVAAVATQRRQAAFEICARLVDEVKARLPIWKRQLFADGSDEWVNCP